MKRLAGTLLLLMFAAGAPRAEWQADESDKRQVKSAREQWA